MILQRNIEGATGTFGTWYDDEGLRLCFTVERPPTGDHPCVPPHTYHFKQYDSPTKGDVWIMTNPPPGRDFIEIHVAQKYDQIKGCIGVGSEVGHLDGLPAVMHSKDTFLMLKSVLPDEFDLTIRGAST